MKLESELNLNVREGVEYKVEAIKDSVVYAIKTTDQLLGLYYRICKKDLSEDESTYEPAFTVIYL